MRGNPSTPWNPTLHKRSIPAGAGEPQLHKSGVSHVQVYPRGCGGTEGATAEYHDDKGLSPRVRGNPLLHPGRQQLHGSIPAGAGEPQALRRKHPIGWVYPRGCGGTSLSSCRWCGGRSIPAGAGEPKTRPACEAIHGSIPAGAGEPMLTGVCLARFRSIPAGAGEPGLG